MNEDLRTLLNQTRDALRTAEQLRQTAENEYRIALKALREIAGALLPAEWNAWKRNNPDTDIWSAEQLGNWIISMAERKLRRAEFLGAAGIDLETLITERDNLQEQLHQLEKALALMETKYEELEKQLTVREAELARLRTEIVLLRDSNSVHAKGQKERREQEEQKEPKEQLTSDVNDIKALSIIGSRGYCLRADIAGALGLDSSSGAVHRLFESLRAKGWIEEIQAEAIGIIGRPPNLFRLSERGYEEYKQFFGIEPVESEYDRLLARHKSTEHLLLNLLARNALLAAGAESVDLYPPPVMFPGGKFEVDIVAIFDGKSLYIEAERPTEKRPRDRSAKWTTYAEVTKEFYIVVPNKEAKTAIISEISLWAYRNPEQAAGVTLRVCQLSAFDGKTLWHHVQHFGGNR